MHACCIIYDRCCQNTYKNKKNIRGIFQGKGRQLQRLVSKRKRPTKYHWITKKEIWLKSLNDSVVIYKAVEHVQNGTLKFTLFANFPCLPQTVGSDKSSNDLLSRKHSYSYSASVLCVRMSQNIVQTQIFTKVVPHTKTCQLPNRQVLN